MACYASRNWAIYLDIRDIEQLQNEMVKFLENVRKASIIINMVYFGKGLLFMLKGKSLTDSGNLLTSLDIKKIYNLIQSMFLNKYTSRKTCLVLHINVFVYTYVHTMSLINVLDVTEDFIRELVDVN